MWKLMFRVSLPIITLRENPMCRGTGNRLMRPTDLLKRMFRKNRKNNSKFLAPKQIKINLETTVHLETGIEKCELL